MMEPLLHIDRDEPLKDVQYDEMVPFLRRIEEQNEALKEQVQERNKQQQEYAAITENMKDGLIVGFDATDDAVEAVKQGKMAATVAQQPLLIGETAVNAVHKVLSGEKIADYIPVELKLITK